MTRGKMGKMQDNHLDNFQIYDLTVEIATDLLKKSFIELSNWITADEVVERVAKYLEDEDLNTPARVEMQNKASEV